MKPAAERWQVDVELDGGRMVTYELLGEPFLLGDQLLGVPDLTSTRDEEGEVIYQLGPRWTRASVPITAPPAKPVALPSRAREPRPRRRRVRSGSRGDPPDDPEPSSSRSLGRLSRGRLGVFRNAFRNSSALTERVTEDAG